MNDLISFVAVFDLHFGFNWRQRRGEWLAEPTHNLKAIQAMMSFVKDFKPDVFILGGDQLNCGPVSHWHRGRPKLDEKFRLVDEMKLLDKHILKPIDELFSEESNKEKRKRQQKIWMKGNHEHWIDQFVCENPGIEGLVEPIHYYNLKSRKWDYYDQGEIYKLGKLYFVHGDVGGAGKNAAMKRALHYRRNIRSGHDHRYEVYTDVSQVDSRDFHTSIIVPTMSSVNPAYRKNAPANYLQGFLVGWINPSTGTFNDYVVIINRNQFIWNGRIYGK